MRASFTISPRFVCSQILEVVFLVSSVSLFWRWDEPLLVKIHGIDIQRSPFVITLTSEHNVFLIRNFGFSLSAALSLCFAVHKTILCITGKGVYEMIAFKSWCKVDPRTMLTSSFRAASLGFYDYEWEIICIGVRQAAWSIWVLKEYYSRSPATRMPSFTRICVDLHHNALNFCSSFCTKSLACIIRMCTKNFIQFYVEMSSRRSQQCQNPVTKTLFDAGFCQTFAVKIQNSAFGTKSALWIIHIALLYIMQKEWRVSECFWWRNWPICSIRHAELHKSQAGMAPLMLPDGYSVNSLEIKCLGTCIGPKRQHLL